MLAIQPPIDAYAAEIPLDGGTVGGDLVIPRGAEAIVVFVHGSGSSRHSPRNRAVAESFNACGLATLLFDLLTPHEEQVDQVTKHLRFDIDLLADRLVAVSDWLAAHPLTARLQIGYFGASTGGGAALVAADARPALVRAVVSRGGRPDLAGAALWRMRVPTLLIVGGRDLPVLDLNREAMEHMPGEKQLTVVPGATHLFEEPGALEQVADLACAWFNRHVAPAERSRAVG